MNFRLLVKLVLLISCIGLASCKTTKKEEDSVSKAADPRTQQSYLEIPLLDFFMASFLIREIFDRNTNICNTPSEQIFVLPQQMKILVDQRFPKERLQYQTMDAISKKNYWPSDCALSCSCSGYILLLEFFKENGVSWTEIEQKAYARLEQQVANETLKKQQCVDQAAWFCKSQIYKDIQKNFVNP